MYGGHRLGDNLFAESLVCLNGETGERVWHFQAVHHGLWDYDFPTAPNLMDITVDGKAIKAVAQVSKQAFTYVFDRVTGQPVWPIEERPVGKTTIPGERSSPTQPFPTKPPAFDRQGISESDLIDFTPELKAEALKIAGEYQLGPLFTPPVVEGTGKPTIMVPSTGGGANWPGAAYDPETQRLYVPSHTTSASFVMVKPDPNRSNFDYVLKSWFTTSVPGPQGLPLLKPPYARVTAIDMNRGEHVWMTPAGDGPRNHPAFRDLDIGPLGQSAGGPLVTKTLLFVAQQGGRGANNSPRINVFDKDDGTLLGHIPLPDNPYGNPVTFLHGGKQYLAIAIGGGPLFSGLTETDLEWDVDDTGASAQAVKALSKMKGTAPALLAFRLP